MIEAISEQLILRVEGNLGQVFGQIFELARRSSANSSSGQGTISARL